MFPFLFPMLLFLYGEFSSCMDTRFVSRSLFYTYMFSLFVPMYAPTHQLGVLLAALTLVAGLLFVIFEVSSLFAKTCFGMTLITVLISYTALYTQEYAFVLAIPYFADHSNLIFRETILAGLISMTPYKVWTPYEYRFAITVGSLWIAEYILL